MRHIVPPASMMPARTSVAHKATRLCRTNTAALLLSRSTIPIALSLPPLPATFCPMPPDISLEHALHTFTPRLPLAVAYSGGADSTALLHACVRRWPQQVQAIHVHHGLQAAAEDFAAHCQRTCTALGIALTVARVDARPRPGQSPEDAARIHRYAALTTYAHQSGAASIALAQHADDQVETLLLALSRGAGVAGLAAMPTFWQRNGLDWHRPLLGTSAHNIRTWLAEQGLTAQHDWIDDPTNTNPAYTRNRIRAHVLPALQATFPQWRHTFARSSTHAAQAARLLAELADIDLQATGTPPRITALQALSPDRQANALRHWLARQHGVTPTAAQLRELLRQIADCRTRGHRIHLRVATGFIRRNGGELGWYNPAVLVPTPAPENCQRTKTTSCPPSPTALGKQLS